MDGEAVSDGGPASGGLCEARDVGVVSDSSQLDGRRATLGVRRGTGVDAVSTEPGGGTSGATGSVQRGADVAGYYPFPVRVVARHGCC